MTNDNKLFESIINSGKEQAEKLISEAEDKATEIMSEAQAKAESEAVTIAKNADAKALNMKNSALSSASLISRNAVLQAKRAEIDKTLDGIVEYILSLDDEKYFEVLYSLANKSENCKGTVSLNEKDLKRLPADFLAKMKSAGIEAVLGEKAADIEGGFILRCDEVEINSSLSAVIEDRKNELEDFINRYLFVEEK